MRVSLMFNSLEDIKLPVHYNEVLQGFIYNHLEPSLADFIHNYGYLYEKRKFKLFTFSRILGDYKVIKNTFIIQPPFKLIISSPINDILNSLCCNLVKKEEFNLYKNKIYLSSVNVELPPKFTDNIIIRMLSPVTVYSTLKKSDSTSKTYFYSPFEKEFSELIKNNLIKKYELIYQTKLLAPKFEITPIKVKNKDNKIIKYKNFVIKAWMGVYNIKGDTYLIEVGYNTGLGSKNSQGFGCFEIIG